MKRHIFVFLFDTALIAYFLGGLLFVWADKLSPYVFVGVGAVLAVAAVILRKRLPSGDH
jgi:hypothetical protein